MTQIKQHLINAWEGSGETRVSLMAWLKPLPATAPCSPTFRPQVVSELGPSAAATGFAALYGVGDGVTRQLQDEAITAIGQCTLHCNLSQGLSM